MAGFRGEERRVLLLGPPNVGKSALFNRLTGLEAVISNYSGTTIDYKEGFMEGDSGSYHIIDVPGTYTLKATNEAEEVAVEMLEMGADLVVAVLDGSNLESSIYLLLEIMKKDLPTLVVVNRVDLLEDKGLKLNREKFITWFDLEVVETVATENKGISRLKNRIEEAMNKSRDFVSDKELPVDWEVAEQINSEVVEFAGRAEADSSLKDWGDRLCRPWPGVPLAFLILGLIFAVVVGLGLGMRQYILLPLMETWIFPVLNASVEALVPSGLIRNILIGEYGFLIKGLEWPFGLVFPYVISFYTGLSLLEDVGYLPRLGVLIDGIFKKAGLSGGSIIPLLLGYGCAIPGIAATRSLPSRRNRVVVSYLICLAIPCIAQTGAIISLLAERSIPVMILLFFVSISALVITALIMSILMPGERNSTVVEIPPLQFSGLEIIYKKIFIRIKSYLTGGALMMVYAIAGAAVLYETGVLVYLGRLLQPVVESWLLLPSEASIPLLLGIVRRELAVLPLLEMDLSTVQLFVGALVALFYVPCVAVLAMTSREFSLKMSGKILLFTVTFSFVIGGLAARLGGLAVQIGGLLL